MRSLRPFAAVVLSASLLGLSAPAGAAPAPTAPLPLSPGSFSAQPMVVSSAALIGQGWACRFLFWC